MHDVIVMGGSISGLLCAREISKKGFSVIILEEDSEIGTPEHCSGLVSMSGLDELGIVIKEDKNHTVAEARIFAPNGRSIEIDATNQKIIQVDRRYLDKQAACQAQENGASVILNARVGGVSGTHIRVGDSIMDAKVIVDARGISSLVQRTREGMMPSAQCQVRASWAGGPVQVHVDAAKYPGFFAWVIPSHNGTAKVGVAGRGINASDALDEFLDRMGDHSVLRRIFSPIWVGGPIPEFVSGSVVTVGDAAGQTKPTTAGGIYTAGMGGILGGRAVALYLETAQEKSLQQYQSAWMQKFGSEFSRQQRARRILERLDNDILNRIFASITPKTVKEISAQDDFDFHAGAIVRILGLGGSLGVLRSVAGRELKHLLRE